MTELPPMYGKPPIIEALVEIVFDRSIDLDAATAAAKALKESYFFEETELQVEAAFDASNSTINQTMVNSPRLISFDRADIVTVRPHSLIVSRLAPYPGWDDFYSRFRRDFDVLKKSAGARKATRVGVRFINRFDVPVEQWVGRNISDFVGIFPVVPNLNGTWAETVGFTAQVELPLDNKRRVRLASAQVSSPVPDAGSFILDIDIIQDVDLPAREDHLWPIMEKMRGYKNMVFEACLTPFTRGLIT